MINRTLKPYWRELSSSLSQLLDHRSTVFLNLNLSLVQHWCPCFLYLCLFPSVLSFFFFVFLSIALFLFLLPWWIAPILLQSMVQRCNAADGIYTARNNWHSREKRSSALLYRSTGGFVRTFLSKKVRRLVFFVCFRKWLLTSILVNSACLFFQDSLSTFKNIKKWKKR
jgi:hypothetical protein